MAVHDPAQSLPLRIQEAQEGSGGCGRVLAATLKTLPDQHDHLDFEDFRAALAKLSVDHREALLLVAAQGMSYEEAAEVCGVASGTIKSRVNRARHRLAEVLDINGDPELGPDNVSKAALSESSLGSLA